MASQQNGINEAADKAAKALDQLTKGAAERAADRAKYRAPERSASTNSSGGASYAPQHDSYSRSESSSSYNDSSQSRSTSSTPENVETSYSGRRSSSTVYNAPSSTAHSRPHSRDTGEVSGFSSASRRHEARYVGERDTSSKVQYKSDSASTAAPKTLQEGMIAQPSDGEKNKLRSTGVYNAKNKEALNQTGNAATYTVENAEQQSDYKGGKREIERMSDLMGGGTASRYGAKATTRLNATRTGKKDAELDARLEKVIGTEKFTAKKYDQNGNLLFDENGKPATKTVERTKYISGSQAKVELRTARYSGMDGSTRLLNDNRRAIIDALSARGVNAKNLSQSEIDRALSTGKLTTLMDPDLKRGIDVSKNGGNQEIRTLLEGLKRSNTKDKPLTDMATGSRGGVKNTVKAWARETAGDSDFYAGFRTAEGARKAAKAGYSAGRGLVTFGGNAGMFLSKIAHNMNYAGASAKAKKELNKAEKAGDAKGIAEAKTKIEGVNERKAKYLETNARHKQKFNDFQSKGISGNIKEKAKAAYKKTEFYKNRTVKKIEKAGAKAEKKLIFSKTHPKFSKFTSIGKKFGRGAATALTSPFKVLGNLMSITGKIKIVLGIAVLIIILTTMFFQAIMQVFQPSPAVEAVVSYFNGEYAKEVARIKLMAQDKARLAGGITVAQYTMNQVSERHEKYIQDIREREKPDVFNVFYKGSYSVMKMSGSGNKSFWYVDDTTGLTSNTVNVSYGKDTLMKLILTMTNFFANNDEGFTDLYTNYAFYLLDKVHELSEIKIWYETIPGDPPTVLKHVEVYFNNCGVQDLMHHAYDVSDDDAHNFVKFPSMNVYAVTDKDSESYITFDGWLDNDPESPTYGDINALSERYGVPARDYFLLDDSDWGLMYASEEGIPLVIAASYAQAFSSSQIDAFIATIKANLRGNQVLTPEREKVIRIGFETCGRTYYNMASGTRSQALIDAGDLSHGLDCSGFMSYLMYKGGIDSTYNSNCTQSFIDAYGSEEHFSGDFTTISPGTMLVRHDKGAASGMSAEQAKIYGYNHIVMYVGTFQLAGEEYPQPHFLESTTAGNKSGPMFTTFNRNDYRFVVNPYNDPEPTPATTS